jgi:hypothetical protein
LVGRGGCARLGVALAVVLGGWAAPARGETSIAIVSPGVCPPELRERIAEQIADVAADVAWSCLARFDEEAPFRSADQNVGLQFWIDLTPATEARLMLRDGRSDRFVARRVPLPRGLDEIGREELGQIVRSALLAVRAGPGDTMTRAEARAEVARWPQPRPQRPTVAPPPAPVAPVTPAARPAGRPLALRIGAFGSARAFASPLPVVAEVGLGLEAGRWGPLGGWIEGAYQIPEQYDGSPLGVRLSAGTARAGLDVSGRLDRAGAVRARLGAGAGLTRTWFTPQETSAAATPAPPGAFWYATGRVLAGIDARAAAHLVIGLMVFLDVVGTDVHYDLSQADGTTLRVLTPHRLQPGGALRVGWSR